MNSGGGAVTARPRARLRAVDRAGVWVRSHALPLYAGAVGGLGLVAMAAILVLSPPWLGVSAPWLQVTSLALALVVGELVPVPVLRGDRAVEPVTISTTFAVALVVLGPLSLLLLVHSLAVAADDLRARRRPLQVVFNCGQYALSLVAARLVFSLLTGQPVLGSAPAFTAAMLLPALAAGVVFALVNDGLVSIVASLATGQSVLTMLREDLRFKLETSGVLVALGPLAALVVGTSVLMLPMLILPVLTVRRTARVAAMHEHQSLHDPLTGLANRELFRRRVERALHAEPANGVAVLMLDLDHFKDVNDTLGHHIGDEVLAEVARRTLAAIGSAAGDVEVARLGGDEFAVLLVDDEPLAHALALADGVLDSLAQPVLAGGTRLSVQASIGITSTQSGPLPDVNSALQQADIALYEAKHERARASVFRPGSWTQGSERLLLLPQLREAVDLGQLAVVYQPQVDVLTGRAVCVEALVRWDHPTQGRLGPGTFIDLAESSGLIAPLTTFVLRSSLRAAAQWRAEGLDVGVAVNLSARLLSDLDLPSTVDALLAEAGVPADVLTVEVTESSLMSDARAARSILLALRDQGVRLSIDDFGTGYSSLVLLQQLDVDELKIDRSFVADLSSGGHAEYLARSIIDLGHNLGQRVVAEGVETAEAAAALAALGCDRLQGFHFARPLELGAATALLLAQAPTSLTRPPGRPVLPGPRVAVVG